MEPPTGPPLTEAELKAGLLREVDLFAGLTPAQLKEVSQTLPIRPAPSAGELAAAQPPCAYVFTGRVRMGEW